jgi:hypothetical protein
MEASQHLLARLAETEPPEPLPVDFAGQVRAQLESERAENRDEVRYHPAGAFRFRFAGVLGALVVLVLLAHVMQRDLDRRAGDGKRLPATWAGAHQIGACFDGPYPIKNWQPESRSGVYAILHREAAGEQGHRLVVDYCGESSRLGLYRQYPWFQQRLDRLLSRAGSLDNIYIAVCPMPNSTSGERRQVVREVVDRVKPYFNRERGV